MTTSSNEPFDILDRLMSYRANNFSEGETNRRAAAEIQKLRQEVKELEFKNKEMYARILQLLRELVK